MPIATDMSGIQYRTLNTRKGDAVQALRVQCDRELYKKAVQKILGQTNIEIIEDEVIDLITDKKTVKGVITKKHKIAAKRIFSIPSITCRDIAPITDNNDVPINFIGTDLLGLISKILYKIHKNDKIEINCIA